MIPYLLVTGDFVTTGGMDRANHALASYLARRGDEVHLVAHRVSPDLLAYPNVFFHGAVKPGNSYLLGAPFLDRLGRYWARRVAAAGGRVIVNGGNCLWGDVNWVHYVHAAYSPTVAGNLIRRGKARFSQWKDRSDERKCLQKARKVIVNSRRTRQDVIQGIGLADSQIKVVYYGTDPNTFRPPDASERSAARAKLKWPAEKAIIVFIGALGDRRKGFDTLFAAWSRIAHITAHKAMLIVVGAGAELPDWQRRITASPEKPDIHLLGRRDDVGQILRAADLLIAPTRYEAFGLGVQEALCCGLPTIVSATAGASEVLNDTLGRLRLNNPDDPAELVNLVQEWWNGRSQLASAAGELAERLLVRTWDTMSSEIVNWIGVN